MSSKNVQNVLFVGDGLKKVRTKLGLNQSQMADNLGIKQGGWSHYEKNRRKPDIEILIQLVLKHNVNINWLLTGKGDMFLLSDEKQKEKFAKLIADALITLVKISSPKVMEEDGGK